MNPTRPRLLAWLIAIATTMSGFGESTRHLEARASDIDPQAREHPEIGFVFGSPQKPQDLQHACFDPRAATRGKLVIWLMPHNAPLFERLGSYGFHAIQIHYANQWFAKLYPGPPPADECFLSKVRLEAATGQDFSDALNIPHADSIMGRSLEFVKWLHLTNPKDGWDRFIDTQGRDLRWDHVILAGISHGATTAARMAKHLKVDRVVMFSGPRDQFERWQALPSATPPERFFGFTHMLDDGWTHDHYCRSWQMLGLHEFGEVTDVDQCAPPFSNSRRLISSADIKGDTKRAHSAVIPGGAAIRDRSGRFHHEAVWRYLFTHPVEKTGEPASPDPNCRMNQRPR